VAFDFIHMINANINGRVQHHLLKRRAQFIWSYLFSYNWKLVLFHLVKK